MAKYAFVALTAAQTPQYFRFANYFDLDLQFAPQPKTDPAYFDHLFKEIVSE